MKNNLITLSFSRTEKKPQEADWWCEYCRAATHGTTFCIRLQDLIHDKVAAGEIKAITRDRNAVVNMISAVCAASDLYDEFLAVWTRPTTAADKKKGVANDVVEDSSQPHPSASKAAKLAQLSQKAP